MFKVQEKVIIWGDCEYPLPAEVSDKVVAKIYGTATAGLLAGSGVFVKANGKSGQYLTPGGTLCAGHIVGDSPEAGTVVYTREQMQPKAPFISFNLISLQQIQNQLNWINIEFEDGTKLVLCPFTFQYEVIDGR
jgi:hypothetical protein